MARPVHYAASHRGGLVFNCWRKEFQPYFDELEALDKKRRETGKWFDVGRPKTPRPKTTTSIDKVTCGQCWKEIYNLAARKRVEFCCPHPPERHTASIMIASDESLEGVCLDCQCKERSLTKIWR